jgi:hypothetical protein
MKNKLDNKYSGISSFEDFRYEKEKLMFRSKLAEVKLNIAYLQVSRMFSVSNLLFSLFREAVLPKISDFLGALIKKTEKKDHSEKVESKE